MRITWQSPFGWRCATTAAKIVREHLSADDRSWQQCRMNIGCSTQASFGNTIWKLILCPIYHMLALECPYGWYHQHQNHFISLWVSLCDRGNNILLFFSGDMASDAQPSDGISLLSFSSFSHFVMLGHGGLLHQCFGRWLQDKRYVQIRWGKACSVGGHWLLRQREGRLSFNSFIYSTFLKQSISPVKL